MTTWRYLRWRLQRAPSGYRCRALDSTLPTALLVANSGVTVWVLAGRIRAEVACGNNTQT